MGLVLLIIIWLITLISTYFFIAKTWWLPVGASVAAAGIDHYFTVTFIPASLDMLGISQPGGIAIGAHLQPPIIRTATIVWRLPGLLLLSSSLSD